MEDQDLVDALDDGPEPEDDDNELDRIDPEPASITLECGIEVHVLPLRTRQLFKMLKIITHGAGQALQNAGLDFGDEPAVFMQKMLSVVLFSIPDSEQETIEFLQSMIEPVGLSNKQPRDMSKAE